MKNQRYIKSAELTDNLTDNLIRDIFNKESKSLEKSLGEALQETTPASPGDPHRDTPLKDSDDTEWI